MPSFPTFSFFNLDECVNRDMNMDFLKVVGFIIAGNSQRSCVMLLRILALLTSQL